MGYVRFLSNVHLRRDAAQEHFPANSPLLLKTAAGWIRCPRRVVQLPKRPRAEELLYPLLDEPQHINAHSHGKVFSSAIFTASQLRSRVEQDRQGKALPLRRTFRLSPRCLAGIRRRGTVHRRRTRNNQNVLGRFTGMRLRVTICQTLLSSDTRQGERLSLTKIQPPCSCATLSSITSTLTPSSMICC